MSCVTALQSTDEPWNDIAQLSQIELLRNVYDHDLSRDYGDRLEEYHRIGVDEFILSGYPHIEEQYWFAEGVMPLLRARGLLGTGAADAREGHGLGVGVGVARSA